VDTHSCGRQIRKHSGSEMNQVAGMPRLAESDDDIVRCFDVIAELRPHLDRESFLGMVRQMEKEGFQLAFIEEQGRVLAVSGCRIYTNLSMGKNLYVDDLVTAADARSKGYGERLLRWLRARAVEAGCNVLHLDSGTHRGRAHKLYFREGFEIASYHFSKKLADR